MNIDVHLKYLGGLHNHLQKKMLPFDPMKINESCVQEQDLDNIGHNNGQPSGSKQKENQDTSKEGNKKWKGKDKKTTTTSHQC